MTNSLRIVGCISLGLMLIVGSWARTSARAVTPAPVLSPSQDSSPASATTVRVFLSRGDNLQWMNFWVALDAGFFAEEGLEVELVIGGRARSFLQGEADVAVMPRPTYLSLVGQERPILAFANLLRHDPINLVVRREVAEELGLSASMSLAERLNRFRCLRVGVAHGPPPRLRVLLESVGLDADSDIEMVMVSGGEQNQAFEEGRVDALYAHTPYLKKALVDQDAVIVVNQSSGQVPGLANRQIHMMVTTQSYAGANPEVLSAMATAVYRAQ